MKNLNIINSQSDDVKPEKIKKSQEVPFPYQEVKTGGASQACPVPGKPEPEKKRITLKFSKEKLNQNKK